MAMFAPLVHRSIVDESGGRQSRRRPLARLSTARSTPTTPTRRSVPTTG